MKKSLTVMLIAISLITAFLVVLGFVFNKPEEEKQQGLSGIFDVSSDGTIANVVYDNGKAGIHLQHEEITFENPVLQFSTKQVIQDINFAPDGSSLAYVVSNKDVEAELESTVHLLTLNSFEKKELFTDSALITEIEFDPKNQAELFYLRAGTFENYSPIASAQPHDFDLYSYRISENSHVQHTELLKYSMGSLNISPTENYAFVQMFDDAHSDTADDVFEAKQRIFQIPLDSDDGVSIVSQADRNEDIFDFVIVPDKDEVIFQSVSNTGTSGIYEYELYQYNSISGQENQLTYLKEYADRPILGPQNNKLFFIVDMQFGNRKADYRLYQMDLDGKNIEEVILDLNVN